MFCVGSVSELSHPNIFPVIIINLYKNVLNYLLIKCANMSYWVRSNCNTQKGNS